MRKDMLILHETNSLHIYSFPNIELKFTLPIFYNVKSKYLDILCVSSNEETFPVIAFKSSENSMNISIDCLGAHKLKSLEKAHNEEICSFCLSYEGELLATCSTFVY